MKKTCCVTGHRDIYEANAVLVEEELRKEITLAIESGYTHFISGFARGCDLTFAKLVVEAKKDNPAITLEAAIPYRGRMKTKDSLFCELIRQCDIVGVHSETYHPGCYMLRNRFMVDNSQVVIAVYDGRKKGGTYATISYALEKSKHVRTIELKPKERNVADCS